MNPPNFMRSAKAPEMSAGVMTANMHWNIMNVRCGRFSAGEPMLSMPTPFRKAKSKPPMRPPMSVPKDREYPQTAQSTETSPSMMNDCMMVARTFLERTSPP